MKPYAIKADVAVLTLKNDAFDNAMTRQNVGGMGPSSHKAHSKFISLAALA